MKYASLLLTGCALLFAAAGNAQVKKKPAAKKPATGYRAVPKGKTTGGFTKTPDGLEYKIVSQGTGTAVPKVGDMLQFHLKQRIGDSVVFNTNNMGKPVDVPMQASAIKGDLMSGLAMMKQGDSAVFRIKLDTLAARASQPVPAWAAKGAYLTWEVRLLQVKSKAEVDAEASAKLKAQGDIDDKAIQEYLKQKGVTNAKKTASGLYYVIHKEGTGPLPAAGKKVAVNYTGINMKGEKFDSSVDTAFHHVEPIEFALGQRNVIAGWDEGIALMNKGATATLYIPSALAYGPQARGPQIPANAILIFDVELVDIKD